MSNAFQRWLKTTVSYDQGRGYCFRKGAYRTKEIAEAYKAKSEARQPGLVLYIYKCPACHKYHLTKQKQAKECE